MRAHAANLITLARVVLVLPFWIAFAGTSARSAAAAVACAFLMELSDLLDGRVARRLGVVSDVGKLLDPAADSFSRLSVFIAFASTPAPGGGDPWFPAWAVVLLLFRDVGVSFIRQLCAVRGVVVAARLTGKLKAAVQAAAIWLILGLNLHATATGALATHARTAAWGACAVTVLVTLVSFVDYLRELRGSGATSAFGGDARNSA
jgi:CDP-diacylglycerol--glycerol-3-phosphate 3-phosphatidyltransferase